jgi:hypothetical protein
VAEGELWHRRLGHRNYADVLKIAKNSIGVPNKMQKPVSKCDVCEVSKHKHTTFKRNDRISSYPTEEKAIKKFQRIDTDLIGPINPQSTGGAHYAAIFTDVKTRWRNIYFLKHKSDMLQVLKHYLMDVNSVMGDVQVERLEQQEISIDQVVASLKSDNGGEYTSNEFRDYCKSKGIQQLFSGPHSPQQNGMAERSNRTVIEMIRCLLQDSQAPAHLWAEAANTAVYLLNRMPTTALHSCETPYKAVYGKEANLQHLRVFGAVAWVHVENQQRTSKLDPKAWRGILVGYDPHNQRVYRIFNPKTQKVHVTAHVTLDEKIDGQPKFMKNHTNNIYPTEDGPINQDINNDEEDQYQVINTLDHSHQTPLLPETTHQEQPPPDQQQEEEEEEQSEIMSNIPEVRRLQLWNMKEPRTSTSVQRTKWCENPICQILPTRHKAHSSEELDEDDINLASPTTTAIHMACIVDEGITSTIGDPLTYNQAMASPHAQAWRRAMEEEYDSLVRNKTWSLVEPPKGANVIKNRWVYKTKRNERGQVTRYKARLVAKGYTQVYGLDYIDTFSPVTKWTTIRTFFAIAASNDWELDNLDVDTAFLNADIEEEIYLQQPKGFEVRTPEGKSQVCLLHKSLYGLKQASHNWNKLIDSYLKSDGLKPSHTDPCMYTSEDKQFVVLLWVDDVIIGSSNKHKVITFKERISKRFKIKDLGALRWILGVEIKRDRENRILEMTQKTYIKDMLKIYGMDDCKSVATPTEGKVRRSPDGVPNRDFMKIVGSILYAAIVSRPDIAYTAQMLGRHMQSSKEEHMKAAKRVLRYLKGTQDIGLVFSGGDFNLSGYSDADWGGDEDTSRSTTGYLYLFGGGPISWNSRLQTTVALSSTEAEYMAVCASVQEAVYLRQLLCDMGYKQNDATTIYEDNQGCIAMTKNPVNHKKSKHISIKFHFIREKVESGEVALQYIPSERQLADIMTKGLAKTQLTILRGLILGGYKRQRSQMDNEED